MIPLQEVRDALAELAPDGWHGYGTTPGDAQLPAMVVGLPNVLVPAEEGTYGFDTAEIPVFAAVRKGHEAKLLEGVQVVADALDAASQSTHAAIAACRVASLTEFGDFKIAAVDVTAATVNLELLLRHIAPEE